MLVLTVHDCDEPVYSSNLLAATLAVTEIIVDNGTPF